MTGSIGEWASDASRCKACWGTGCRRRTISRPDYRLLLVPSLMLKGCDQGYLNHPLERWQPDRLLLMLTFSGGSFTAAYYGLFGDRIFEENVPPEWMSEAITRLRRAAAAIFDGSSEFQRLLKDLDEERAGTDSPQPLGAHP